MIVLSGADLVLPGGVQPGGTLVIDGDRIVDITASPEAARSSSSLAGHLIVPGFIDVHVHGVEGVDTLDGPDAISGLSQRLPKYGVTAFCPTTVACGPEKLRQVLQNVDSLRRVIDSGARVLPAHLESNFINPDFRGAQPIACLRTIAGGLSLEEFSGDDIVREIDRAGESVGIVTLAPELDGALDLIQHLVSDGRIVSLGHSGATLEQGQSAIDAGARQATHLFNRMPPLNHREPGLVGAVLASEQIAAEIICDGVHVHPHMVRTAIALKGAMRVMAITDAVAAAGLPSGSKAQLGGREIRVRNSAAYLEDGTLAGSVSTMDRVFQFLVRDVGLSLSDAARLCSTTPASELKLKDLGAIARGAIADLVVFDRDFNVKQTYVAGRLVYSSLPFSSPATGC
jgi:N-acetylglucosamine-6-phosphate deacetylase